MSVLSTREIAEMKSENSFWLVDGLLKNFSNNFRSHYNLGHAIDIDEMCVYFKGRQ